MRPKKPGLQEAVSSQRRGEKICAPGKITMLDEWILAWDGLILLEKCMTPLFLLTGTAPFCTQAL
ncbi:MAG: hypothetical protein NTX42_06655 [Methanothrix sp.]|nr:hypothetical protein [Methanothrix sp.]